MPTSGTGAFTFTSWDEQTYASGDGSAKLTHAAVTNAFHGVIEGESTLEYLMVYLTESSGSFVGLEQVRGRAGERTGAFVLRHSGTFEAQTVRATWEVVPGSASGELTGLRGSGGYVAESGQKDTPYTLDYDFEP